MKLTSKTKKIMSKSQVKEFIMFYERISRHMMKDFYRISDITVFLAHGGFFMSLFWKKLSEYPMVPSNEPRLKDSIKGNY